jgi:hypothetical protein
MQIGEKNSVTPTLVFRERDRVRIELNEVLRCERERRFHPHEVASLLNKEIHVCRDVVLQRSDRGEVVVVGDVV